ncbi:metallopeptidase family protein [Candidatus Saccharibacteria bacterium TM7i]|nr:metallopeptidase family protein [Candidatus Saccharibacteria bacterium TM7i]
MHIDVTDEAFNALISRAMDELPQEYIKGLENVVITYADEPDEHQRKNAHLDEGGGFLLGLYEGVPLTKRGSGAFSLPDKITLFKHAILAVSPTPEAFYEQIKRTLWHEIAHYYGLEHEDMDRLQNK